ncbi:hypothetical protein HaLaN_17754, partial [Haematococcus lacustris]
WSSARYLGHHKVLERLNSAIERGLTSSIEGLTTPYTQRMLNDMSFGKGLCQSWGGCSASHTVQFVSGHSALFTKCHNSGALSPPFRGHYALLHPHAGARNRLPETHYRDRESLAYSKESSKAGCKPTAATRRLSEVVVEVVSEISKAAAERPQRVREFQVVVDDLRAEIAYSRAILQQMRAGSKAAGAGTSSIA